jgi:glutamyl endopeptidase
VNAPAIAATVASSAPTTSQRFSLVSSSGQVVDSSSLNQTKTLSVGSSGALGRPEALGANTTPLTDSELAAIKTTTPTAAARIINESVLGFDSRFHVNPYAYPQRAVSLITYNGRTHCTGWLVSDDTLVTAGHCVHGGGSNGRWGSPSAFKIYPGFSDGYAPYGSCQPREIYSSYGWISAADGDADVGVIKLNCAIGNATGYFSYFVTAQTDNAAITINGYPGDKANGNEQWGSTGVISRSTPTKIYYDNDTTGGMSGAPVWLQHDNTAWALGIHTNGESLLSPGTNAGTRISQDVFDLITAVKELP